MSDVESKITIQSATSPGHVQCVDRAKYIAMRDALMAVLPLKPPGITVAEAKARTSAAAARPPVPRRR